MKKAGDYYVVVEDFRGCKGEDGSTVKRLCDFTFYMSNAFTPNDDSLNDVFLPLAADIFGYHIEIYNRWGQLVFSSNNPSDGWDGTCKNIPCPGGSYVWKLTFKGFQNKVLRNYNHNGVVNLLR